MLDKKVALFGCGSEIQTVLAGLYEKVEIVAFGTDPSTNANAQESLEFCRKNSIPILNHYSEVDSFLPDYIFMVSYPPLIPDQYLEKYKFINVHNALLPRYRGFHGQTWALVNGETKHGYSVHEVDAGIDSGPIYYQDQFSITLDDDINTVKRKCSDLYNKNIVDVLLRIFEGKITSVPQNNDDAIYVTKRRPEDSEIKWDWTSEIIFNQIRALTPPYTDGAYTFHGDKKIYITKSKLTKLPSYFAIPGKVLSKQGAGVLVKTGSNPILIEEIVVDGERFLPKDYFRTVGIKLG